MKNAIFLAARYLLFYRWKSLLIILCLTLTGYVPILLWLVLGEFDQRIAARADSTPLVIGPPGSGVDLTLHGLYFTARPKDGVPARELQRISDSKFAHAVPLHCHFTARGFPVVGTTIDYFDLRNIDTAEGRFFGTIGDCVIGADVARDLRLVVGDKLMSDRENLIDIAGQYPLRMTIVGVLERSGTADDRAVFTDVKSSWMMLGLGHGHDDLRDETDPHKVLSREQGRVVASAAVLPYLEITPELMDSVHFHGDPDEFPLTAILAFPFDEKSETLLIGRYESPGGSRAAQAIVPKDVIRDLMKLVFQVTQLFQANMLLVGISTVCLLGLVIALSLRLRANEMETMFRLGCSRSMIFNLQAAEMMIVVAISVVCIAALVFASKSWVGQILERLIVGTT